MTKNEYLAELKAHLASLPAEERDGAIKYYQEFFEDAGAENEQKVIEELGDPKSLAEKIISEINEGGAASSKYVPASPGYAGNGGKNFEEKPKRNENTKILIIILLAIIFSPLLVPLAGVILGLVAGLFGLLIGFFALCGGAVVGLIAGGIAAVVMGIGLLCSGQIMGLLAGGIGLIMLAVGVLLIIPFVWLCANVFPPLFRGLVNLISKPFHRKKVAY